MASATRLVVLFYCCATADILTKLLQQCFLIFIVVPWLYLGNSQVSVYRTIGPTLVIFDWIFFILAGNKDNYKSLDEFEFGQNSTADSGVSCP